MIIVYEMKQEEGQDIIGVSVGDIVLDAGVQGAYYNIYTDANGVAYFSIFSTCEIMFDNFAIVPVEGDIIIDGGNSHFPDTARRTGISSAPSPTRARANTNQ